jgi:hypothetical protein
MANALEALVESRTTELRAAEERQRVLLEVNNAVVSCRDRDFPLPCRGRAPLPGSSLRPRRAHPLRPGARCSACWGRPMPWRLPSPR